MKYGETLRQRSIPEWAHHNINYDEIKHLIKEHTTPGSNKPVSIPGQGDVSEREFEHQLFAIFAEQHQYIVLFVKSKVHEIEGRLNHLRRQLSQVEARQATHPATRIPPKRLARISRLEDDVLKTGEEIRSLSQFINVQKLAFHKLIKKYRKWTSSEHLGEKFTEHILDQPDSIARVDVGPLLDQFLEILQDVRDLVQRPGKAKHLYLTPPTDAVSMLPPDAKSSRTADYPSARLNTTIETGSEGDLDITLATCPLGTSASRAIYWVHPEQVLELKVLLLQHTRPFPNERRRSGKSTPTSKPGHILTRRDSGASDRIDETHVMLLDDLEAFAKAQSSVTVKEAEKAVGGVVTRTAGLALWSGASEAHIVLGATMDQDTTSAIIKPKRIGSLLDLSQTFERQPASVQFQPDVQAIDMADDYEQKTKRVRDWLTDNPKVTPLVTIHSRRNRFVGLNNDAGQGCWATLDTEITMSRAPQVNEMVGEWWNNAQDLNEFPFAVLDVRQEGEVEADLIKILDSNHLTERVRGFSIETHAVWTCSQPKSMCAPFWLPLLSKDIRKVPSNRRQAAKIIDAVEASTNSSSPAGPPSTDATSVTTGGLASSSSGNVVSNTSITSPSDNPQSSYGAAHTAKRKKALQSRRLTPPTEDHTKMNGDATVTKYWSEYDHPEDGSDDEAYYIYVDPDASMKFPGQDTMEKWYHSIRSVLHFRSSSTGPTAEQDALMTRNYFENSERGPENDDNESTTSSDRSPLATTPALVHYGTFDGARDAQQSSNDARPQSYDLLRNLFHGPSLTDSSTRPVAVYDPLSQLNLPTIEAQHDYFKSRIALLSFFASIALLVVSLTLAATGRRKLYEEVDAVVVVGIVVNLCFAVLGLIYTLTRRDDLGVVKRGLVWSVFGTICVLDGVLIGWMFA